MKIRYDQAHDHLYIDLSTAKVADTDEVAPGIIVDYDVDGTVTGVEILDVSERKDALQEIGFEVLGKSA